MRDFVAECGIELEAAAERQIAGRRPRRSRAPLMRRVAALAAIAAVAAAALSALPRSPEEVATAPAASELAPHLEAFRRPATADDALGDAGVPGVDLESRRLREDRPYAVFAVLTTEHLCMVVTRDGDRVFGACNPRRHPDRPLVGSIPIVDGGDIVVALVPEGFTGAHVEGSLANGIRGNVLFATHIGTEQVLLKRAEGSVREFRIPAGGNPVLRQAYTLDGKPAERPDAQEAAGGCQADSVPVIACFSSDRTREAAQP